MSETKPKKRKREQKITNEDKELMGIDDNYLYKAYKHADKGSKKRKILCEPISEGIIRFDKIEVQPSELRNTIGDPRSVLKSLLLQATQNMKPLYSTWPVHSDELNQEMIESEEMNSDDDDVSVHTETIKDEDDFQIIDMENDKDSKDNPRVFSNVPASLYLSAQRSWRKYKSDDNNTSKLPRHIGIAIALQTQHFTELYVKEILKIKKMADRTKTTFDFKTASTLALSRLPSDMQFN